MSDAAITVVISGLVTITTMVVGFLTLWIKLRYGVSKAEEAATKAQVVERKVDNNTELTKAGTAAAATNAKIAANTAAEAKEAANQIAERFNGKLEDRITAVVKAQIEPIAVVMRLHAEQDDRNMREIRQALDELRDQVKAAK